MVDVSTLRKARKYLEMVEFIVWFYFISVPIIRLLVIYVPLKTPQTFFIYVFLRSFGVMISLLTLLFMCISFFDNTRTFLPEFQSMHKFISLNVFKTLINIINTYLLFWPPKKIQTNTSKETDIHILGTFYTSIAYLVSSLIVVWAFSNFESLEEKIN